VWDGVVRCGPPSITVTFVSPPVSCADSAEESKTVPRMPGSFVSYPDDGRGIRYPNPGGCSGVPEEDEGKTRFMTVTEADEFASRCGRGVDDGSNLLSVEVGNADTTCEASNES
jgi:hypothetical protein